MGNWSVAIYDNYADMKTAVELLDSAAVSLNISAFKDGSHTKIIVVKST